MSGRSAPMRLLLKILAPLWRFRRLGLATEVLYWDLLIRRRVIDGHASWLEDGVRPVARSLWPLIEQVSSDPVKILEVGAGPIATIGFSHPTRRLQITPTDVLAAKYDRILGKRGITPFVRTIYADAERLTAQFGADAFDLVYAANCLDHMRDPLTAIREMVSVVRPGGHVVMEHLVDEGVQQDYSGLHQWNLRAEDGHFILWNPSHRYDVSALLSPTCDVRVQLAEGDTRDSNLRVEVRKRPTAPEVPENSAPG